MDFPKEAAAEIAGLGGNVVISAKDYSAQDAKEIIMVNVAASGSPVLQNARRYNPSEIYDIAEAAGSSLTIHLTD